MAGNAASETSVQASIISDVKSYSGNDPLLPWLRGIKKLEESLPRSTVPEKLPLFLLKCVQEFESHSRYKNDLRFIRVWLKLMDYMDDAIHMLKRMETNGIGTKKSLYYRALALYYEKKKNYKEAEKIYHLGIQVNAEPLEELSDSLEQFLVRMQRQNSKKNLRDEVRKRNKPLSVRKWKENGENKKVIEDDTVVIKFVGRTVEGNPEVENACHHGLVDPTINMKEAMNAINNMFRAPMASAFVRKRKPRALEDSDNKISFYADESGNKKSDNSSFHVYVDGEKDETFFVLKDDEISSKSGELCIADEEKVVVPNALGSMKDELLEPTMCTREAIDDINKMFAITLD